MTRLVIGIFDGEAELIKYEREGGHEMEITFSEPYDGFITFGELTVRVKEGKSLLDVRLLDDGEYTPFLILKDCRRRLPRLAKRSRALEPIDPDSDFIREVSLRERKLSKRVAELEAQIEKISKSVYGTTLF